MMDREWVPFFAPDDNGSFHENSSLDVMRKNCFGDFDTTACIRSSLLSTASAVTGVLCILRLWRFHMIPGQKSYHHLTLFYVMVIHCFTESAEWVLGWTTQTSLASLYLRSLELLIICHFYLTLTCRVMHCTGELAGRLAVLSLSTLFVYFTSFLVIGFVYLTSTWFDCYAKYWVFISAGHVLTVQLLVMTSVLLSRKINAVCGQDTVKRQQKRDLWSLTIILELSAFSSLAYHIAMANLANGEIGCSGVFHHRQSCYSVVRVPYELLVVLFPLWIIVWVFRPNTNITKDDELHSINNSSFSSEGGVMMDPAIVPPPAVRNWRQRYRPLNSGRRLLLPGSQIPYNRIGHSGRGHRSRGPSIRRTASAPSNMSGQQRRSYKGTPSVMSPPPLATIPEESGQSNANSQQPSPAPGSSPIGQILPTVIVDVQHVSA